MPFKAGSAVIGVDGDDTLWHMEHMYVDAQEEFAAILAGYCSKADALDYLLKVEQKNVSIFGYGVKGFMLSLVEAALDLSDRRLSGDEVGAVLAAGRKILTAPTVLLDGVSDAIRSMAQSHPLILITKGDLFHQEHRIAETGLAKYFTAIEVVAEKTPDQYRTTLGAHDIAIAIEDFVMVGNSVRSDITPVLDIGARAIHVPYHVTWAHEDRDKPNHQDDAHQRLWTVERLADVPALLAEII